MLSLVSPTMVLSRTGTVPPWPMIRSVTPCQPRNSARVTTKDGMRDDADQQAGEQADDRAGDQREQHRPPPVQTAAGHLHGHDRGADAAHHAGGQVDLAQQQDEDQAHRQQADRHRLHEQVGEVQRRREGRGPQRGEQDRQDDDAGDGREGPEVTAADPVDVAAEVAADRAVGVVALEAALRRSGSRAGRRPRAGRRRPRARGWRCCCSCRLRPLPRVRPARDPGRPIGRR